MRGQAVVAYVVPKHDGLTVRDLVAFCNGSNHLPPYKRPRFYRIVDQIPYNATGKKLHYAIKQQAAKDLEAGLLKRS